MTFELVADGIRFWCSSPAYTRKLVEKGARLVDPAQAALLSEGEEPRARPAARRTRKRQRKSSDRRAPAER